MPITDGNHVDYTYDGIEQLKTAVGSESGGAPRRNALSRANRQRDPPMAETLFWQMLDHLQQFHPGFGARRHPRFAFRFKRLIHVVDSTTIQLAARCLDGPNIADLYRCRWSIKVFFKELKQTLQLADFLGHNARA